jgi:hypothetical protein
MFIKINENHRVTMQIADKYSADMVPDNVTSFRVQDAEIPPLAVAGEFLCFDPITRAFYTEKIELTEEQRERIRARETASRKREAALKWLSDNDWKVNKHTLGEWSDDDERWLAYLADRAKVRAAIDDADAIIKGGAL